MLQADSEYDGTAEQEEQTLQVQKISSKIRSTCDGIRNANEISLKGIRKDKQNHQESKSTHSSEYSSGSPDEPAIHRNRVCVANSAPARASESAQLNSSTSSNMATYYQQCPHFNT